MRRSKGFTLLELLLVIALLAILAAAIGPNFISSAQLSLDASRKARFLTNYASITLGAGMFLMASETSVLIRNGNPGAYETYAMSTTDGLGLLVASNTLQAETCMYENVSGETRWFAMAVGPITGGTASYSVKISSTPGAFTSIAYTTPNSIEKRLETQSLTDIWEGLKAQ